MKENVFERVETSYEKARRAHRLTVKADKELEQGRGYFYKIVGNPPILRRVEKLLDKPLLPSLLICGSGMGLLFVGMTILSHIAMVFLCAGVMASIFILTKKEDNLDRVRRKERERIKNHIFHGDPCRDRD